MRAGDVLIDAGRPVAYHAGIARALRSIPAALMLTQLLYWSDKAEDGWVWKFEQDWDDELALTPKQMKGARTILVDLGLIEHKRDGLPAKPYYRVDLDALDAWWEGALSSDKSGQKGRTGPAKRAGQGGPKGPDIPLLALDDGIDDLHQRAFDEFWAAYPRKDDKKASRAAFTAACKRAAPTAIIAGAGRYRDDPNRSSAYTKMATTWLRADAWDNPPLPPRSTPRPGPYRPPIIDTDRSGPSRVLTEDDL